MASRINRNRRSYVCGTCGKSFENIVLKRSHQSRVCSIQPPVATAERVNADALNSPAAPQDHDMATNLAAYTELENGSNTGQVDDEVGAVQHDDDDNDDGQVPIQEDFFELSESVMSFLDNQLRVSDDIFAFYDALTQHSEPMVPQQVQVPDYVSELPTSVHLFIQHCTQENLTRRAISRLYDLFTQYEQNLPEHLRVVTAHIPSLRNLYGLLRTLRLSNLYLEGWRVAVIDLNDLHRPLKLDIPVNRTGTFRCPLHLGINELQRVGINQLRPFRGSINGDGVRSFSSPIDSRAFEAYSNAINVRGHILCIDIYADGIALPKSGTQTMCPLRVRFPNVNGVETKWHEVGLCPVLDCTGFKCSADKRAEFRRELLQRYLFLVLKPLIRASSVGTRVGSTLIFPRILMAVCDQKQERPFVCLRSTGATRDCTLCDMGSKITKAEERRQQQEVDEEASDDSSIGTSNSHDSIDTVLQGADVDADSVKTQLNPQCARPRNVVRSVGAQLVVAIIKVEKGKEATTEIISTMKKTMSKQWFQLSDRDKKDIRDYIIVQSCCEFPSVFAAVHGLGTEPFLLYQSIAFDSLHVLDLGVVRMLPDHCHHHFSSKQFTNRPAAQCISIANKRLVSLPRGAHLPKIELFLNTKKQKLGGITGLVRRSTLPFLWICLLGLNDKVTPDSDPLVQAALELAHLHSLLLGCNEATQSRHRTEVWIQDIQRRCFQLGVLFVELFNINVNTKLHRFMRHIHCHLTSFGMLRWGANDDNESLHKAVKKAYTLTNRRPAGLARQILQAGYADNDSHHRSAPPIRARSNLPELTLIRLLTAPIRTTERELSSPSPFSSTVDRAVRITYKSTGGRVWTKMQFITLDTNIPWEVDRSVQYITETYTYRPWYTDGPDIRIDGCEYLRGGTTMHGIVQVLLRSTRQQTCVFFVIRRLESTDPPAGNALCVTKFNHGYYKYATNDHGLIQLDLVPSRDIQYPLFFVPDPTVTVDVFQDPYTDFHRFECDANRLKTRFFRIASVSLTSFRESLSLLSDI